MKRIFNEFDEHRQMYLEVCRIAQQGSPWETHEFTPSEETTYSSFKAQIPSLPLLPGVSIPAPFEE